MRLERGPAEFDRVAGVLLLALTCLAAGGFSIGAGKGFSGQDAGQAPKAKPKTSPSAKPKIVRRSEYVGDQACAQCHQDKFDTYEKTAHNLTSQIANQDTIVGTFTPGANTMTTANANLSFEMDKKGEEFFQTAIWASPDGGAPRTHTERLDLVIGSGGKGQTYLYWRDNQLFNCQQVTRRFCTDGLPALVTSMGKPILNARSSRVVWSATRRTSLRLSRIRK